jgi:putative serine protease PepD
MTAAWRGAAVAFIALAAVVAAAVVAGSGNGGAGADADAAPVSTTVSGLQQRFVRVVRTVSPQVVEVQTPVGLGSGVVFDASGDIVTNAHVVGDAHRFAVRLMGGEKHPATLVGSDPSHDLAVIKLVAARPTPAKFADSASLDVGDLVLAIGNPLGLRSSVTEGIVSSLGRTVAEGNGVTLSPVIQTSAAINPGNSGGALVDLTGRVIGVPTLAALDPEFGATEAPGIGFAIPSNTVEQIAARLIAAG